MNATIVPYEESEQRVVAEWLDLHGVRWFHVPNERGSRSKVNNAILKRLGVKPGVCDIIIIDPPPVRPESPGTVIELKRRKGGRLSPEQKEWLAAFQLRGWVGRMCKGADEAIDYLESLGYGKTRVG